MIKKKKVIKKEDDLGIISYRDYLLAKAYGGEPKFTTLSQSSRPSSRGHSKFRSNSKLRNMARNKLSNLSMTVSGF